ncbi:hypothetical protein AB833_02185 [Chromatiales bacterium (ex Bugula neritina AB1)]|nr:hypothetical protein AB833_02185 [Chromatiales bacterium (ex Bugula neritina AB1)]
MLLTGLVLIFSPFVFSLEPSAKTKAERSQHNIADLASGDFLIEPFERDDRGESVVIIIKDWDSTIYTHMAPTVNGNVAMPDDRWWWLNSRYHCSSFGPESLANGKIKQSGFIKCHDANAPQWREDSWTWPYNGQSKVSWMGNMFSPAHEIKGSHLYINL